jgi:hypothetical protein
MRGERASERARSRESEGESDQPALPLSPSPPPLSLSLTPRPLPPARPLVHSLPLARLNPHSDGRCARLLVAVLARLEPAVRLPRRLQRGPLPRRPRLPRALRAAAPPQPAPRRAPVSSRRRAEHVLRRLGHDALLEPRLPAPAAVRRALGQFFAERLEGALALRAHAHGRRCGAARRAQRPRRRRAGQWCGAARRGTARRSLSLARSSLATPQRALLPTAPFHATPRHPPCAAPSFPGRPFRRRCTSTRARFCRRRRRR